MTDDRNDFDFDRALRRSLERIAPAADARLAQRLLSRTAAEPQRRRWSFFSAVAPAMALAAVVALAMVAGLALREGNRNIGGDESPRPSVSAPASPSAADETGRSSPTQSQSPSASAAPTAGAFPDAQRCTNDALGFEVAYPGGWHTNGQVQQDFADPIPACTYFGEEPLEISPNSAVPETVAISFNRIEDEQPTMPGTEVVSQEERTVDDRPAIATELAYTQGDGPFTAADDRAYSIEMELEDGSRLVASTSWSARSQTESREEYEAHRSVLDRMMEALLIR